MLTTHFEHVRDSIHSFASRMSFEEYNMTGREYRRWAKRQYVLRKYIQKVREELETLMCMPAEGFGSQFAKTARMIYHLEVLHQTTLAEFESKAQVYH